MRTELVAIPQCQPNSPDMDAGRFFFYSNEGSEPPHVHVESGDGTAKLWLTRRRCW